MAAGFVAHGDDRVAAAFLQPACFIHGGGAANDERAGGLDPIEQGLGRGKLTISGRSSSTNWQLVSSNGARLETGVGALKSRPCSR